MGSVPALESGNGAGQVKSGAGGARGGFAGVWRADRQMPPANPFGFYLLSFVTRQL